VKNNTSDQDEKENTGTTKPPGGKKLSDPTKIDARLKPEPPLPKP
jgi:hypothetical protein